MVTPTFSKIKNPGLKSKGYCKIKARKNLIYMTERKTHSSLCVGGM